MSSVAEGIADLLARHRLDPSKALGQNFVTDPEVISEIVRLSGVVEGSDVLEVGPGLGSLTSALAESGAHVLAVEKDERLLAVLREVVAERHHDTVELVHADALGANWAELLGAGRWRMVSNLPYNVAVPILLRLLAEAPMVDSMWAMVQLEVAQRLCAGAGGRTIGVPSIKVDWYADARIVLMVEPHSFTPVPRVRSAVVELRRTDAPRDDVGPGEVFALVEAAYRKRRKMLRSSLAGMVTPEQMLAAGVEPTARPEELDVNQWAALAASRAGTLR